MSKLTMLCHFKKMIDEAAKPLFDMRSPRTLSGVYLSGDVDGYCKAILKEYIKEIGLRVDYWRTNRGFNDCTRKTEIVGADITFSNPKKDNTISLAEAEELLGKTIIVEV